MKTQNKVPQASGIKSDLKKYSVLFSAFLFQTCYVFSQTQSYDNFEGNKSVHYCGKSGVLDTVAKNPAPGTVDKSEKCAKYVRNSTKKYDNIKICSKKLIDVSAYATYLGNPPKISMKVYTTAPIGTLIEIQLGKQGKNEYPQGINSKFQARTTVTKAWEEIQFKFSEIPKGSETSATEVDQITLLFNPNSLTKDTYYFDDIKGPAINSDKFGSLDSGTPMNNAADESK